MGIITDKVSIAEWAMRLGAHLSLTSEQIGMKAGVVFSAIFPLIGIAIVIITRKYFNKNRN